MPTGAPKICSKAGCFALAVKRSRCEAHQPKPKNNWKKSDIKRENSNARGYTSKWRKASQNYLKANPLCVEHRKQGRKVPATLVDHRIPHRGDKQLFWAVDNWQGLCKDCHDIKTGKGE